MNFTAKGGLTVDFPFRYRTNQVARGAVPPFALPLSWQCQMQLTFIKSVPCTDVSCLGP